MTFDLSSSANGCIDPFLEKVQLHQHFLFLFCRTSWPGEWNKTISLDDVMSITYPLRFSNANKEMLTNLVRETTDADADDGYSAHRNVRLPIHLDITGEVITGQFRYFPWHFVNPFRAMDMSNMTIICSASKSGTIRALRHFNAVTLFYYLYFLDSELRKLIEIAI